MVASGSMNTVGGSEIGGGNSNQSTPYTSNRALEDYIPGVPELKAKATVTATDFALRTALWFLGK